MSEDFSNIIHDICKGNTGLFESFFRRPGGRKYLENITLILINTLPHHYGEKEQMYRRFVQVLDGMEQHLRQQEGAEILESVFGRD